MKKSALFILAMSAGRGSKEWASVPGGRSRVTSANFPPMLLEKSYKGKSVVTILIFRESCRDAGPLSQEAAASDRIMIRDKARENTADFPLAVNCFPAFPAALSDPATDVPRFRRRAACPVSGPCIMTAV